MEPTGVATIVRMGPLSIKSRPRREAAIWCLCPWATILGEPLLFLQLDPKLFLVLAKLCCRCQKFDFQTTPSLQVVGLNQISNHPLQKNLFKNMLYHKGSIQKLKKLLKYFVVSMSESNSNIYCP